MKTKNREKIIDGAIDVFLKQGITKTSMKQIAEYVDYDRRTIYRYFESKDQLVLDVIVSILKSWNDLQSKIYKSLNGNGLEKLKQFHELLIQKIDEFIPVRLITEFDSLFELESLPNNEKNNELINQYVFQANYPLELKKSILTEGVNDGSIKEIDVESMSLVIHNVLWGVLQKRSTTNKLINKQLKIDFKEIVIEQLNIYISYLST